MSGDDLQQLLEELRKQRLEIEALRLEIAALRGLSEPPQQLDYWGHPVPNTQRTRGTTSDWSDPDAFMLHKAKGWTL